MVLALWLALAATEAPPPPLGPTAVVIVRRTSVKAGDARDLARVVSEALEKESVTLAFEPDAAAKRLASVGVKSPEKCAGRRECIHEFARQLKVQALVTVSISQLGGERALGVELYSTVDEKVLLKDSIVFPAKEMPSIDLLQGFARKVKPLTLGEPDVPDKPPGDTPPGDTPPGDTPPGDTPPTDVPPADPNLKNPVVKDPDVVVAPVEPPKSHAAGLVTGGAAIAAAVAAGALSAFALLNKADLERTETLTDGTVVSPHTTSQAEALRGRTNTLFTAAAACGGGALALGATAVFVW